MINKINEIASYKDLCEVFGSRAIDDMFDKIEYGCAQTEIIAYAADKFGINSNKIISSINSWVGRSKSLEQ